MKLRIVGILVSLVAGAAVVAWALQQEPPTFPSGGSELWALVGAVALYFVVTAVRGERWQRLLVHNGAHPTRADSYGLVAVGYMGNNVLPARAGDAFRVVFMSRRAETDARTVIGTLLAERLLDVAVLGVGFVALAYGTAGGAGIPSGDRLRIVLAVGAALAVAGAVLLVVMHRSGHLERIWRFLSPMAAATVRLRGLHGAAMLAVTLVIWALEASVWWLVGEAAGMGLSGVEACYLLALASMFSLIPSGPGYAGTMDAAIIFGAHALDRSSSSALSYLLLLRFVLFVPITALGLLLLVTRYGGWGRMRRAREDELRLEEAEAVTG